jgi:hypothetical protein
MRQEDRETLSQRKRRKGVKGIERLKASATWGTMLVELSSKRLGLIGILAPFFPNRKILARSP